MTTTTSEIAGGYAVARVSRFSWTRMLFAFALTVLGAALFVGAFLFGYARLHDGRVMPGVEVAGVPLAGLDRAAAETKLRAELPSLSQHTLTLDIGGERRSLGYAELGRDYDLSQMLDEALSVGRDGTLVEQASEQMHALLRGTHVGVSTGFDAARLQALVASAGASVDRAPADAAIIASGDGFGVRPAVEGRAVDTVAAAAAARAAVDNSNGGDTTVELQPRVIEPDVTTAEAQAAASRASALTSGPLQLSTGTETVSIPVAALRSWITFSKGDGSLSVRLDETKARAAIEAMRDKVASPGHDATFAFVSPTSSDVKVVPAVSGQALDIDRTVAQVLAALEAQGGGSPAPTIQLSLAPSDPTFTTAQAQALLPRFQKVSSWTTHYPVGPNNFFSKNITTPARKINGYLVEPGAKFDFWEVVGEVSKATGYGPGAAIINGKTEVTGALAGGICSCSTTIFNAALRYGLEMGARRNHYYYITRYPVGLDATVFKGSSSVQTMSFTNDTPYPILIRGIGTPGVVTFQLYSVPTGRTVSFSSPAIYNVKYAPDSIEYTDKLAPGVRKRVEHPTKGFDVTVVRTVRDAKGNVIHTDTYRSHYATITGVTEVGRGPNDPPAGTQVILGGG